MIEEEIDLRQYITIFVKYWYWIVGGTLGVILVAWGITFLITPLYEARALVAIIQPRLFFQFTQDIRNNENRSPNYQAFPYLATNDDLLFRLADSLNEEGILITSERSKVTLLQLRNALAASSTTDTSLVALTVRMSDPQTATLVANHWVDLYIASVNDIYGSSEKSKETIETDLDRIEDELADLETKLVDIGAQTGQGLLSTEILERTSEQQQQRVTLQTIDKSTYAEFGILGEELETKVQSLVDNKARRDAIGALILQAERLQTLVEQGQIEEPVAVATLLADLVQITTPNSQSDITVEVNLTTDASTEIADILAILESNRLSTETVIETMEAEVAELQQEMAVQRRVFNDLFRQRILKQEVYLSLARKVAESEIGGEERQPVQLVSYAVVPQSPVWPQRSLVMAIAGILGFFILTFGVFALEWWRSDDRATTKE